MILEGEVTLRFGDERLTMKKGDFMSFPAGQRIGHCFVNEGTQPVRYLVIGERKAVRFASTRTPTRSLSMPSAISTTWLRSVTTGTCENT